MVTYGLTKLAPAFNAVIAEFPTYFQTTSAMYRDIFAAIQAEGKTGSDSDDPFTRRYNWCYGAKDFAEELFVAVEYGTAINGVTYGPMVKPSDCDGVNKAARFKDIHNLFWALVMAFGGNSLGNAASPRPSLNMGGEACPLKILRSDNANITNTQLKKQMSPYYGLADTIAQVGCFASVKEMFAMNFPIDTSGISHSQLEALTFRELIDYIRRCPLRCDDPNGTGNLIYLRQVVSYAEYELRPLFDAKFQACDEHMAGCANCEELGECDEYLVLYDEACRLESQTEQYIATYAHLGNILSADDYMGDPYYYAYSYGQEFKNPLRVVSVESARLPTRNYTGSLASYSLTTGWNALNPGGGGYTDAVYNVVLERNFALPFLSFDHTETTYTNGNPNYIKSNLWAFLNSKKGNYKDNSRLFAENQHKDDAFYATFRSYVYRGYLCCLGDDLLKHTVGFRELEQIKNANGSFSSTHIARVSYVTIAHSRDYKYDYNSKIGTYSLANHTPNYDDYAILISYYDNLDAKALTETRKMVLPTFRSGSLATARQIALGVATRTMLATTGKVVALDANGDLVADYPNSTSMFAARPRHRMFPFYLTEKMGVPRNFTIGVTLEET